MKSIMILAIALLGFGFAFTTSDELQQTNPDYVLVMSDGSEIDVPLTYTSLLDGCWASSTTDAEFFDCADDNPAFNAWLISQGGGPVLPDHMKHDCCARVHLSTESCWIRIPETCDKCTNRDCRPMSW